MTRTATAQLLLITRWLHSRDARRTSLILAATFAVLAAVFVCTSAFTLGAGQQADSEFGIYEQRTYDSVNIGDLTPSFMEHARAVLASNAPGSDLFIETPELRPDSFTKTYVQSPLATVRFVQDPQIRASFPGRYTLDQGDWPTRASDVVVSRHVFNALPDRVHFTMLSGRARLHVVGVVTDAYAKHDDLIIAGPGTWESIPRPSPGHAYQPVDAQVNVLFETGASLDGVRRTLEAVLPPLPAAQGARSETIDANYSSRAQVAAEPTAGFGGRTQLVVTYLPLLLIVLLVSALAVGQTRRGFTANADRLVALGARRRTVRRCQVIALEVAALASIAAGLGVGWLVALGLRATVLSHFADEPLSPVPGINLATLGIAVSSLVVISVGALWPSRGPGATLQPAVSGLLDDVHLGLIRRVVLVLLVLTARRVGGGDGSVVSSYLVVAAVLLAAPDLLRVVLWCLPRRAARAFLIRRFMKSDAARQAAAVVVVAACLAIPICAATQLASDKASQSALTYNLVPARQVWVQNTGDMGDVTAVARLVSQVPHIGSPVVVRGLTGRPGRRGQAGPSARFVRTPRYGSIGTDPMVLNSATQLRQLIGPGLANNAEAVLNAGGVVDFSQGVGDQQIAVFPAGGGAPERLTPTLPTVHVSVSRQFTTQFAGAVLLSTARRLSLPVSDPKKYIYTDVPHDTISAAAAAAVDAGYDSEFVQYDVPPPTPDLPIEAYVFLAGLIAGSFAVLLLVIGEQAKRLRTYSARMIAIGLTPRWILSILAIQTALIIGTGLLIGTAAALLGVTISADNYPVLNVPVLPITLACLATIVAAGLATALAVRALRATENLELT